MSKFMCRINPDADIRTMTRKDFMELPQIDDDLYYCDSLILIPKEYPYIGKNKLYEVSYMNMYGVTVIKDIIPRYLITDWSNLILIENDCRIDGFPITGHYRIGCLLKTGFIRIRNHIRNGLLKVQRAGGDITVENIPKHTLTNLIESEGDQLLVEHKLGYKLPSTLQKEASELAEDALELDREMWGYSKIE